MLASGTTPQTGTVGYVVKDQYGTDITKEALAANITWTSSVGTATDNNEGVLTVNKGAEIKVGDTIVVTGVDAASGKTVTATLKAVDAAALKEVTFGDLKLPTNKTRVEIGLTNAAEVAVTAKDQYGNDITTASAINAATQIVVSDPAVQATWVDVDNKPYLRLDTSGLTTAKKVTVTVVIKSTGQTVQYTFDVVKPSEAAEISAAAPTDVIAAGDVAGKVVVPLVVKDQFGKELTLDEIAANAGGITITSSNSSVLQSTDLQIATTGDNKGKPVNINPVLGEGKTVITLTVNATGKSVSFELEAKAARKLSTIEFPTDLATFLIQGAQTTTQLKYKDQYGADFDATSDVTNHKIVLEVSKVSGDDNGLTVTPNGDVTDESTLDITNAITINAAAGKKGTYTLSAKLVNTTTNEVVSQATKTFTVGENSSTGLTYSVGEIGKIFKDSVNRGSSPTAIDPEEIALGYAKEIKITAKDTSGNSYVIPQSEILSISVDKPSVATVGQVNDKWYIAGGNTTAGSDNVTDDTTVNLSVVINTKEGVKTITQPVVVSKEDLTPAEIKLLDKPITNTTAKAVTELTFNDLVELRSGKTVYAYVIDQFGGIGLDFGEITDETVASIDGLTLANGDSVVITDNKLALTPGTVGTAITKANATFRYVAYTANGKTASINVKVANVSSIASTGVTLGPVNVTTQGADAVAAKGTINFSTLNDNDTVVVDGNTFTKVASNPDQANGEFSNADELTALINALPSVNASNNNGTITVTAATPGNAGNGIQFDVAGTIGTLTDGSDAVTEVATVPVTAGATSSGNVKVTVNGVDYQVAVTAGDTPTQVAAKIATALNGNVAGYTVTSNGSNVVFTATTPGAVTDIAVQ
ncbi:beta strand repeat-containing protein [Ureibacillus thermophilus]|uniref:beta strand repeat-containing protein n=1 Tax=Ureibacillus thermophilus TaxID=367743 RepID=UPI00361A7128